jgi:hypothetical protein
MALEYPFKILLYVVVIVVVISIILLLRKEVASLNFCWIWKCEEKECKTVRASENFIGKAVIDKYCNLCWQKSGEIELKEDCLCYVVSGSFTPLNYVSEHCELKCNSNSQFLTFTYSSIFKKIFVEC